jgi:hypothetical protein
MSRQYFADVIADPPTANLTAVVATVETGLWNVAQFTPIGGGDARDRKIYRVCAGGIWSTAAGAATLIITPRFGTTTGGITLGASGAQTVPVSLVNVPWSMEFTLVVRSVGAPGGNSTIVGTGFFRTQGTLATAGSGMIVSFGGTVVTTADLSVAGGVFIGWTLSVAGSCTPEYAFIQSLN